MNENQGKTYSKSCEIAGTLLLIGCTEDYEDKYKGEEYLGKETADNAHSCLKAICTCAGKVNIGSKESENG